AQEPVAARSFQDAVQPLASDDTAAGSSEQDASTERPSTEVSATELCREFELEGQFGHCDLVGRGVGARQPACSHTQHRSMHWSMCESEREGLLRTAYCAQISSQTAADRPNFAVDSGTKTGHLSKPSAGQEDKRSINTQQVNRSGESN